MKDKPVILIVDDHPKNIELLEVYLVPQGYEIVRATNGEEALGKLSSIQIDLILLDILMPGMDGFEVTRRVRQNNIHRLLPIILVTVLREKEDRVKGIEAGCDDFISTPVDKMELLARVRSLLKVKAYNDLMSNYQKELESEVFRRTEELKDALENLRQDITERKRAEEALLTKTMLLEAQSETSIDGILAVDNEGRSILFNKCFGELWKIPRYILETKDDTMMLEHVIKQLKFPEEFYRKVAYLYKHRDEKSREEIEFADGRYFDRYSSPLLNTDGQYLGRIWFFRDITDRKRAEESLRNSLEEKELLLNELYHRTKNNMQVICGLLELKSAHLNDPKMHEIYTEIQTKIQTMALVHQKLYESKDLTNINLHDFINSLSDLMMRNYALAPEKLAIKQSVDDVPLSIDTALPLGLVLNELISNSIKHAITGDNRGEIQIEIHRIGEDMRLEYRDNGTGLPEGFDPATSTTLGMHIIQNISKKQLGGDIRFLNEKGFGCIINFKTNLYRRRI